MQGSCIGCGRDGERGGSSEKHKIKVRTPCLIVSESLFRISSPRAKEPAKKLLLLKYGVHFGAIEHASASEVTYSSRGA